ncbi:hypothetical protein A3K34_03360 [candidate division WWE3 bacterium RIFOXYC1_FULL_40_10]|uniref:Uncharacterized protein n=1 Tax=candidate division WWE3 bacterium RIFOXYA2_FULL_46_9 TaxID=1802636 RepID=A0A1F4VZM4_UNCKA|nr:MAG: hypothetical protein A3K58_03360 [candidate division WWE3 bacterium RIFOXYB1_FULL_40_22]OGC61886.1 MAG: hypothetical protein A3K37_03360 [candidate division WWE3 bacterium RIFOXYA1_FULL_40_11]OGC62253.1 MAG: hypothetical protein A2264_03120 [candidate division WWE3 bacterium RIFOXYA2_FULL_46_9]OGC64358.1 MAG: hypothetical protein A2326_00775 [candidate division WWE3 bacterium RIFOXYB2_FULL_41_6]OGC66269.1 MAG: hypothetical protein A3K34_03360 [candidate division WWE3 bacterium RIFOXYC1_
MYQTSILEREPYTALVEVIPNLGAHLAHIDLSVLLIEIAKKPYLKLQAKMSFSDPKHGPPEYHSYILKLEDLELAWQATEMFRRIFVLPHGAIQDINDPIECQNPFLECVIMLSEPLFMRIHVACILARRFPGGFLGVLNSRKEIMDRHPNLNFAKQRLKELEVGA